MATNGLTVYVYGQSEAEVLFPDDEGAIVREVDDEGETWFPWPVLTLEPTGEPKHWGGW